VIKVTSAAIFGSDLRMYEGRTGADPGLVFGHESMGIVEEVGDGVATLSRGDRVVLPSNVVTVARSSRVSTSRPPLGIE
jgi:glutathione-independent formaldehyde dehydrogenase